jgi:carboxypeptidase C (cathepsin A)
MLNQFGRIFIAAVLPFFVLITARGQAIPESTERRSQTRQQGYFNGRPVRYTAIVQEHFFSPDSNHIPVVSAITTSYIKDTGASVADRPVLFVFNGGPGASSSPLHMSALGPKRFVPEKDSNMLVDNTYSLLDVVDLVFVDPPGTGFTRVFDTKAAGGYWDVKGDAQLFIDLIKKWKKENKRESSPLFLCGESYGTARAAAMLGIAEDLPVAGVIFLSSVFDLTIVNPALGNDMPYILFLPSMAAVATYHHKSGLNSTAEKAYSTAMQFALNEYIMALGKGVNLAIAEKKKIAYRLSQLTGLSQQLILEKDLRITPLDFEKNLLAAEGKRVGQLNGQITGPLNNPSVKPPFDDPSMSFKPSNRSAVTAYFKNNLQFADTGIYKTLNLVVNSRWNWNSLAEEVGYLTWAPGITKALKEQPKLKLLVAGGMYDMATPLYAGRYVLEHVGVTPNRVTYAAFPTGHSIFENEKELDKLVHLIRQFILK